MFEITLDDLVQELGSYKKNGQHYYFQCKYCLDEHKDNMIYTPSKGLLKCFAVDNHASMLLSEIMKKKHEEKKMHEIPRYLKLQKQYLYYAGLCHDMLLGNYMEGWLEQSLAEKMLSIQEIEELIKISKSDTPRKARAYLKEQRGINTHTIELTGLGFDFIEGRWVIPITKRDGTIVGFEYRAKNFKQKKIWREAGTPSCLAWVYGIGKKAIIQEGFLDSYCTVQMLDEKDTLSEYTIFTTSAGVAATSKVITQLQFNKYDSISLLLDNDEAGDKATEEIIAKYPFIKDDRGMLKRTGCKDVNEYMLGFKR